MLSKAVFSVLLCFSIPATTFFGHNPDSGAKDAGSYKVVYSRENVTLHERPIVNDEGQDTREIKAVFAVEASVPALVKLLKDPGKGVEWNAGACSYNVLNYGDDNWITHIEYDLPWPLSNHDAVVKHFVQKHSGNLLEVYLESVEGVIPEQKGVERMQLVKGKWTIRQINPSLIEVSYQVSSKPSPLPKILTDPIVHHQMVRSMSTLRRLLEESEI